MNIKYLILYLFYFFLCCSGSCILSINDNEIILTNNDNNSILFSYFINDIDNTTFISNYGNIILLKDINFKDKAISIKNNSINFCIDSICYSMINFSSIYIYSHYSSFLNQYLNENQESYNNTFSSFYDPSFPYITIYLNNDKINKKSIIPKDEPTCCNQLAATINTNTCTCNGTYTVISTNDIEYLSDTVITASSIYITGNNISAIGTIFNASEIIVIASEIMFSSRNTIFDANSITIESTFVYFLNPNIPIGPTFIYNETLTVSTITPNNVYSETVIMLFEDQILFDAQSEANIQLSSVVEAEINTIIQIESVELHNANITVTGFGNSQIGILFPNEVLFTGDLTIFSNLVAEDSELEFINTVNFENTNVHIELLGISENAMKLTDLEIDHSNVNIDINCICDCYSQYSALMNIKYSNFSITSNSINSTCDRDFTNIQFITCEINVLNSNVNINSSLLSLDGNTNTMTGVEFDECSFFFNNSQFIVTSIVEGLDVQGLYMNSPLYSPQVIPSNNVISFHSTAKSLNTCVGIILDIQSTFSAIVSNTNFEAIINCNNSIGINIRTTQVPGNFMNCTFNTISNTQISHNPVGIDTDFAIFNNCDFDVSIIGLNEAHNALIATGDEESIQFNDCTVNIYLDQSFVQSVAVELSNIIIGGTTIFDVTTFGVNTTAILMENSIGGEQLVLLASGLIEFYLACVLLDDLTIINTSPKVGIHVINSELAYTSINMSSTAILTGISFSNSPLYPFILPSSLVLYGNSTSEDGIIFNSLENIHLYNATLTGISRQNKGIIFNQNITFHDNMNLMGNSNSSIGIEFHTNVFFLDVIGNITSYGIARALFFNNDFTITNSELFIYVTSPCTSFDINDDSIDAIDITNSTFIISSIVQNLDSFECGSFTNAVSIGFVRSIGISSISIESSVLDFSQNVTAVLIIGYMINENPLNQFSISGEVNLAQISAGEYILGVNILNVVEVTNIHITGRILNSEGSNDNSIGIFGNFTVFTNCFLDGTVEGRFDILGHAVALSYVELISSPVEGICIYEENIEDTLACVILSYTTIKGSDIHVNTVGLSNIIGVIINNEFNILMSTIQSTVTSESLSRAISMESSVQVNIDNSVLDGNIISCNNSCTGILLLSRMVTTNFMNISGSTNNCDNCYGVHAINAFFNGNSYVIDGIGRIGTYISDFRGRFTTMDITGNSLSNNIGIYFDVDIDVGINSRLSITTLNNIEMNFPNSISFDIINAVVIFTANILSSTTNLDIMIPNVGDLNFDATLSIEGELNFNANNFNLERRVIVNNNGNVMGDINFNHEGVTIINAGISGNSIYFRNGESILCGPINAINTVELNPSNICLSNPLEIIAPVIIINSLNGNGNVIIEAESQLHINDNIGLISDLRSLAIRNTNNINILSSVEFIKTLNDQIYIGDTLLIDSEINLISSNGIILLNIDVSSDFSYMMNLNGNSIISELNIIFSNIDLTLVNGSHAINGNILGTTFVNDAILTGFGQLNILNLASNTIIHPDAISINQNSLRISSLELDFFTEFSFYIVSNEIYARIYIDNIISNNNSIYVNIDELSVLANETLYIINNIQESSISNTFKKGEPPFGTFLQTCDVIQTSSFSMYASFDDAGPFSALSRTSLSLNGQSSPLAVNDTCNTFCTINKLCTCCINVLVNDIEPSNNICNTGDTLVIESNPPTFQEEEGVICLEILFSTNTTIIEDYNLFKGTLSSQGFIQFTYLENPNGPSLSPSLQISQTPSPSLQILQTPSVLLNSISLTNIQSNVNSPSNSIPTSSNIPSIQTSNSISPVPLVSFILAPPIPVISVNLPSNIICATPIPSNPNILPSRISGIFPPSTLASCINNECNIGFIQGTIENIGLIIPLVLNSGINVGTVILPSDVNIENNIITINIISNIPSNNNQNLGITSIDITITDIFGNEITQFQDDIIICFEQEDIDDDACLSFFNTDTNEWECEDECLEKNGTTVCGSTDHLTSFALLLNGNSNKSGDLCESTTYDKIIAYLSLAFACVALICIILTIILIEIKYFYKNMKIKYRLAQINAMPTQNFG